MKKKGDILDGIEFSKSYSDRNGQLLQVFLTSDDKYRIYRPLQDYPQAFLDTLLLQEDRFFYTHHGVNFVSVIKAGWETYIKNRDELVLLQLPCRLQNSSMVFIQNQFREN